MKAEIEKILLEGQQRTDYDPSRSPIRTWKDRNISAQDMESYLRAYDIAHDLERKIRLSEALKANGYRHTDFAEHTPPLYHQPKEQQVKPQPQPLPAVGN